MGILGKVLPAIANVDTLLYKVGSGKQAIVTISGCNVLGATTTARVAVVKDADLAVQSAAVTSSGSGYSSIPAVTVTGANTTPASLAVGTLKVTSASINANGSGYSPGDTITLVGGTFTIAATLTVTTTSGNGGITGFSVANTGVYLALHVGNAAIVTGGTGTGATFSAIRYGILSLAVTTSGNGYVSAPVIDAPQAGATGFSAVASMGALVESSDYIEYDVAIVASGVLERSGILLAANEMAFVRSGTASSIAFVALGLEEVA